MCVIWIGEDDMEFLAITLLGRTHPDATDFWDGNWLRARVDVKAGGFLGCVEGDLRTDELARLLEEMSQLDEALQGAAEFATMEGWLRVRVIACRRGHIDFECEVKDYPGTGNTLTCQLTYDQTYLRPVLTQLAQALREYPVIGESGG